MTLSHTRHRLANGLRVVVHRDDTLPVVAVAMAYHVGSSDEEPGRRGFAHLFEHLMFQGSAHVPAGAFDAHCEAAGGRNNAYTCEDKTVYDMVVPSQHLETALWLESDRLLALDLSEEAFENQRHVVLEEKLQTEDNQPYGSAERRMAALLFAGTPYGHPVIGETADIEAATRTDAVAFHEEHYTPGNAVLCLAGDLDPDAALRAVERWFGDIPPGVAPTRRDKIVSLAETPTFQVEDVREQVPLPAVMLGWAVPPDETDAFLALDLAVEALGSGERARLRRRLVHELRVASSVWAFADGRMGCGLVSVGAVAAPGRTAEQLDTALREEVRALLTQPPDAHEMRRLRARIEAQFWQSLQPLASRADRLAHYTLLHGDPARAHAALARLLACDSAGMRDVAGRWLVDRVPATLHYLPIDGEETP